MTNYVLFSIDNVTDTHTLAKFLRYIDTQVAMQNTEGYMIQCIGSYKGKLELSFILNEKDYINHVLPLAFTKRQESVLLLQRDSAWLTTSCDPSLTETKDIHGYMTQVSKKKAMKSDGWIYRPDIDAYFMIKS